MICTESSPWTNFDTRSKSHGLEADRDRYHDVPRWLRSTSRAHIRASLLASSGPRKGGASAFLPMCRVKEGRVTKPGATAGAAPRRRGRPAIDWTRSRKRKLLRLYLCTPESELSLKKILELLSEGSFQPKPRHTQCLLNDMLSKSYRQKRPRNRAKMAERLAFLRSIRDDDYQQGPQPRPKCCDILLMSNPGGRKTYDVQARDMRGEPDEPDSPGSPANQRPETTSSPNHGSLDAGEPRPPSEGRDAERNSEGISPELFKNPWSAGENIRRETVEFLTERCPSRSSSFLADVASLLDGLSIRSSLSRSSSSSSCRSARSVSSRGEASSTRPPGDWDTDRPCTTASLTASQAWSSDTQMSPGAGRISPSSMAWASQEAAEPQNPGSSSYTQENQELVRFCCSRTASCIHQRINAVLEHGFPADAFACTAAEVNSRDGLGNTALHVAARWGAPGPVLLRIMTLASDLSFANHRGETFLHVLDPTFLSAAEISHFTKYVASRGGFDFTQLDEAKQTFITRLMSRPSFSLESLEAIFSHLCEPDRLTLLHHQNLIDAIRARLPLYQPGGIPPDPAQAAAAISSYCDYFHARYGTRHGPIWITRSLFCHLPVHQHAGRNRLHQLIAGLNVGRFMHPPTRYDLCLNLNIALRPPASSPSSSSSSSSSPFSPLFSSPFSSSPFSSPTNTTGITTLLPHPPPPPTTSSPTFPFLHALTTALDTYPSSPNTDDINTPEHTTLRTPLITLLRGLAWGQHSEAAATQLVQLMLARGARPAQADVEGDTALHWAARLGLLGAVVLFVRGDGGGGLRGVVNLRGQTARDVGVEAGRWAGLVPRMGGGGGLVRHAEVVRFLETGVLPG